MHDTTRIIVIYDSIYNAVFESQVLTPCKQWLQKSVRHNAYIVSFEQSIDSAPAMLEEIPLIAFKRTFYLGMWQLQQQIQQLRSFLAKHTHYELIARGPFAGYIALHARTTACQKLIIQARGLATEEYAFTHQKSNPIMRLLRTKQLRALEKQVYSTNAPDVIIEAVSPALKAHLIDTFGTPATRTTLAEHDLPAAMQKTARAAHRQRIRAACNIGANATVYCYSGSHKPWQCPKETIAYFKQQAAQNADACLLLLTTDITPFAQELSAQDIPPHRYRLLRVTPEQLPSYLAAADYGLLFRDNHIINKTARPTKALEYAAAGLTIIHNGTVDYLHDMRHTIDSQKPS